MILLLFYKLPRNSSLRKLGWSCASVDSFFAFNRISLQSYCGLINLSCAVTSWLETWLQQVRSLLRWWQHWTLSLSESSVETLWSATIHSLSNILMRQLVCICAVWLSYVFLGSVVGRIWNAASGWCLVTTFGQLHSLKRLSNGMPDLEAHIWDLFHGSF